MNTLQQNQILDGFNRYQQDRYYLRLKVMTSKQSVQRNKRLLKDVQKQISDIEPKYLILKKLEISLSNLITLDEPVCTIRLKPDVLAMIGNPMNQTDRD